MAKKTKYILHHIDDDKDFCDAFQLRARQKGISVISSSSFEEFSEKVKVNTSKIIGVVLDIRCLRNKDQEIENEDFLVYAIRVLDRDYSHIPKYVLTGNEESRIKFADIVDEKIYNKERSEMETLFDDIKSAADNLDNKKLLDKYSDVFEVFDKGYMSIDLFEDLFALLRDMNSGDLTVVKKNISIIRVLLEGLYQGIHKIDKGLIPASAFKDERGKKTLMFWDAHRNLAGNFDNYRKTTTTEVYYSENCRELATTLYSATCDTGAHNPYESPKYPPTKYTVLALANGLCDLIIWAIKILDERLGSVKQ
ncbi:MAG: hypothetical protein RBT15_07235 [Gudongella sp.]|jgi:hypothetical protein|nr:hypothetical protein [Gudongella sp.]